MTMAENKLMQLILSAEKPYRPTQSLEPAQAEGAYAVKCEEGAFLLIREDGWRYLEEPGGRAVSPADPLPSAQDLDGWRAQLAYAPDRAVFCDFEAGALVCEGERIPVRVSALRPKLFLITGSDPRFVLILDTARFLFYGGAEGRPFGGYIRNMPQT